LLRGIRDPARWHQWWRMYPPCRPQKVTDARCGQPPFRFPARLRLEAARRIVGKVVEPGVLAEELELERTRGTVSLLADDDLGQALVLGVFLVVVLVAVDEHDDVRVLLDRA